MARGKKTGDAKKASRICHPVCSGGLFWPSRSRYVMESILYCLRFALEWAYDELLGLCHIGPARCNRTSAYRDWAAAQATWAPWPIRI